MSIDDGIIMKGKQIVVPRIMQSDILARLHTSHQGIEKTCLRARNCVFWHGYDKDIKELIGKCDICLEFSKTQQKEKMILHELPCRPWQKLGTDVFEFEGQKYLFQK